MNMPKRTELRLDIVATLVVCVVGTCGTAWLLASNVTGPLMLRDFIVNCLMLGSAMLLEAGNLARPRADGARARDRGLLSAAVTATALVAVPAFSYFVFNLLVTPHREVWLLGVLVFAIGTGLRFIASRTLGLFFNHALVIQQRHQLIDIGIYRYVRHPAYLGTLLMILGSSWAFYTHVGVFLALGGLLFALRRIRREEAMLEQEFGNKYVEYKRRTDALVPWVH